MDRTRFDHLLDAYGADFNRWPPDERAAGAAFAAGNADALAHPLKEARALDAALSLTAGTPEVAPELLTARILKARPRPQAFNYRAAIALAACAVFGVILGYGGGLLAPVAQQDDGYFAAAFEAPYDLTGDEG